MDRECKRERDRGERRSEKERQTKNQMVRERDRRYIKTEREEREK